MGKASQAKKVNRAASTGGGRTAGRKAPVGWYSGTSVLDSGWAWGQQYLDGGTGIAEATVGEGKVVLLGPEVNFRDQPHGTFKLLFNGLYYGSAKSAYQPSLGHMGTCSVAVSHFV